jgi:predicted transposase YbfD/YdcC
VTIYCPETRQVLDKRTLDDKEGERLAVIEIITKIGHQIPSGIISADAGIVSPMVTEAVIAAGHGYVLQIKGNSGMAYEEAGDLPWDRVVVANEEKSRGHGREELRVVKAIEAEFVDLQEFDKYKNIGVVLQVERTSRQTKTGKVTNETSYYIGDEVFASFSLAMQARYIREHWGQESYHWIKDKVMQEDDSMQRTANGSRTLSTIRSLVAKLGRATCDSPKAFIDRFTADPHNIALSL